MARIAPPFKSATWILICVIASWSFGAALAQTYQIPGTKNKVEHGVDRRGGDYQRRSSSRAWQDCYSACVRDRRCRAWTFVRAGRQRPNPRCYLKNIIPKASRENCCISGFINPLWSAETCRAIGNIRGRGSVTCVGSGGRDLGKAGPGFSSSEKIFVLLRFKRLPLGPKTLEALYTHNNTISKKIIKFTNNNKNWALWFPVPAPQRTRGRWRAEVYFDPYESYLAGQAAGGLQVLGTLEYCVNCARE